ncbi:hypothetical protein LBMAG42_05320 [Deltaproteobacteria bacterium]|nr:hypothetical protein LBMAG42_05320 [Deltaproteobacteria bacterium]
MSRTLRPGDTVDRYTVEALLGEGGMASVYAVRHNTLGSQHALKLLKVANDAIRDRLVSEGKVQASLRHPNIVAVTDVLMVDGQPGLLMERIDGPGLDQWLGENRPDLEDALKLFRGILAGVSRAHRAGLVHRDLKPGNVLLDSADGMVIPKVADFGLAKILADDGDHSKTRAGSAMGTPQFMAPEQIRSAKDVDPRADIFALGCILYVLVCGSLPFDDADLLALYNKIASGRYQPPEAVVPGLDPAVAAAIHACLQVDRENRPRDCDALRALLYHSDDTLAGGVKLSRGGDLRPLPRFIPLVAGETRLPTAMERKTTVRGATRTPAPVSAGPSTFTLGAVAVGGVGALGALIVLLGIGVWWVGFREPSAQSAAPDAAATTEPPVAAAVEIAIATDPPVAPESPGVEGAKREAATKPPPAERPPPGPKPGPVSKPKPVAAETGELVARGTFASLKAERGGKSWPPGSLPAGSYTIRYQFEGRSEQTLQDVEVTAGHTTVVKCEASLSMCVKQ